MSNPMPPPPISAGQKWYTNASFLSWLITTAISIGGGIATLVGHPFDSAAVTGIGTGVAWGIAGLTTAIFIHGQTQLQMHRMSLEHDARMRELYPNQ